MLMKPLRILFNTEAHFLNSGYGNYSFQVLKRLQATGKYVLGELSSYGKVNDPRIRPECDWWYYANAPSDNASQEEKKEYASRESNQFGMWRFERTLLDFKADVVFGIRDYWMSFFEQESPLRPYYHSVYMPTVDSAPQDNQWVDNYLKADGILTYSKFGKQTLESQFGGLKKVNGIAGGGIDSGLFGTAVDKDKNRRFLGLSPDINIVGTVMRNQKRKRFPDLFKAFRQFLNECDKEVRDKTYLYIHTSYPERHGWKIPELLKHYKITNKVYCTYLCRNCGHIFAAIFADAKTTCINCAGASCILPNVIDGLSYEQMVRIYNVFDLYVQYSICEGLGIPIIEAAACGVPFMAIDYSAMSNLIVELSGQGLKPYELSRELETNADRAIPDNNELVKALISFFKKPDDIRRRHGARSQKLAYQHYNWDAVAKQWENYFDNVQLKGRQGQWDIAPPSLFTPNTNVPQDLSNLEFVDWAASNILDRSWYKFSTYDFLSCLRELNHGLKIGRGQIKKVNRENIINRFSKLCNNRNNVERGRCGIDQLSVPDYIIYAHQRKRQ